MKKYLLLAGVLLLSGCSTKYRESPIATNFKTTQQHKLQSLHHWKVITDDIAKSVNPNLKTVPIYLNLPSDTIFQKNFNDLLRDSLINKGFNIVLTQRDATVTIDDNINVVKFDSRKFNLNKDRDSVGKYTFIGSLATGAAVISNSHISNAGGIGIALATLAGADAYKYFHSYKTDTPIYEISITLNIKDRVKYIGSVNRVYYIADRDFKLYEDTGAVFHITKG